MGEPAATSSKYFLPYQVKWLNDQSRLKIVEKSRRVGLTYVQSYEDVRDAARREKPIDVWFSSADESAAKEYIRYCAMWAKILNVAAKDLGETVISKNDDIKALTIELATGKRINALSSNPKGFRSKGGKLVLDEFAFHGDQDEMWKAARPIITWGFPARILSTYNGTGNRYYRMCTEAKKLRDNGSPPLWSLHSVDIVTAVNQGLADKLLQRPLTLEERQQWLDDERAGCGDEDTWQQEYMCNPVDSALAWLTWELIIACESADAGKPDLYSGNACYLGWDVARFKDKSVMWVVEKIGDVDVTREVVTMRKTTFAEQHAAFDRLMNTYQCRRACIDQTGLGIPVVEDAQRRWGAFKVEGVTFTSEVKQHLATYGKQKFEDRKVRLPVDREIRDSHHAVRKMTTIAGNSRFDADRNEAGHADEFWAHMLALHAGENSSPPSYGESVESSPGTYRSERGNGRPSMGIFNRDRVEARNRAVSDASDQTGGDAPDQQ